MLQDDIIDELEPFVNAANVLKDRGAYKIYVMATHGLLSSDAPRRIEDSCIDEVRNYTYPYITSLCSRPPTGLTHRGSPKMLTVSNWADTQGES